MTINRKNAFLIALLFIFGGTTKLYSHDIEDTGDRVFIAYKYQQGFGKDVCLGRLCLCQLSIYPNDKYYDDVIALIHNIPHYDWEGEGPDFTELFIKYKSRKWRVDKFGHILKTYSAISESGKEYTYQVRAYLSEENSLKLATMLEDMAPSDVDRGSCYKGQIEYPHIGKIDQ